MGASSAVLAVAAFTLPLVVAVAPSEAENRVVLRFGAMVLDLEPSAETPLFGGHVERAVASYNGLAALERAGGGTTPEIDARDLGVSETLYVFAPGIELGGAHYFLRIEAPIAHGGELTSAGIGIYPLNLQARLHRGVVGYLSVGGSASWLDRAGEGDIGGLVTARAAGGVRLARHIVVEVGYSAFALGGTIHLDRLEEMVTGAAEVIEPDRVLAAGHARGLVDVGLGVAF